MLTLKSKLAIMMALSFLCALIFTIPVSAQSGSGGVVDLKGTGSTGSFSYDDQGQGSPIGHGAKQQRSEGSKSKFSSSGSTKKGYDHHISGSNSHKKSEGSKSKSYSHGKPGHGKSSHAYKGSHGKSYGHKKSEGSKSKSYSHGKPGHGKSSHAYKGGHGYSHKKSEGSKSKSYSHGKPGHGKSYGHKSKSHPHGGHNQNPFQHVLHFKKKLGLTNSQIQSMKELELDFKKKGIQADADHEIAHLELDRHVHSGELDEAKIRAAGAKIVASKTNKIMAMIDAKIQLLKLLTAEQRQKMVKMH